MLASVPVSVAALGNPERTTCRRPCYSGPMKVADLKDGLLNWLAFLFFVAVVVMFVCDMVGAIGF